MTQRKMVRVIAVVAALLARSVNAQQDTDSLRIRFGAFVDVYYAYDMGRPPTLDRQFTTTAARHSEFNINLAHIEARLTGARVRGRFALQAGTSVQANYASEPRLGVVSGPDLTRLIQEAVLGYNIGRVWVDAGIYLAPFGMESWISSENPTYTRSLMADYSPYYASGIRVIWPLADRVSAQVHLMNGWQIVSESNNGKSVATRLDYTVSSDLDLSYVAFVGNEVPDSGAAAVRVFQEAIARFRVGKNVELSAAVDYGFQPGRTNTSGGVWRGWSFLIRNRVSNKVSLSGRVEAFSDPNQIVSSTGVLSGLRASGGSVTFDVTPEPGFLWRIEVRALRAKDRLFLRRDDQPAFRNVVLVSSAAIKFPPR